MKKTSAKMGFVGDIALTHDYDVLYSAKGPHYPFEHMKELFASHDVLVGNLEAPFCLGGETYPMKLSLRAHPGYAEGLHEAGFSVMTLGNNHILDYREKAFYETMDILDSCGLKGCGAGANVREARTPAIIREKGFSAAVLSCSDVSIDSPFYADETTRGIAPMDMNVLEADIRALRKEADIVVVSPHWGKEDWRYPLPLQVAKARLMIDMGAHLVIGHHPHVLQGIERYRNGWIAYSLGNFLFSDLDWRWLNHEGEVKNARIVQGRARRKTMLLSVVVTDKKISDVHLVPCRIGPDLRVRPVGSLLSPVAMGMLARPLSMKRYDLFWDRYDRLTSLRRLLAGNARRAKNIHKLRFSHLREMTDLIARIARRGKPSHEPWE